MNSENWPASNVWVFTAQLVEHCSANAEAKGSNPVEVPKFFISFFGLISIAKLQIPLRRSYLHSNLCFRSSHQLQ